MGSPVSFMDLSSDEEENRSLDKLADGFSAAFDDLAEAAGAEKSPPPVDQMMTGDHSGEEDCVGDDNSDDDCQVLDSDPDMLVAVTPGNEIGQDGGDELAIVGEKGQLACRDFPHSRHLCSNFPFSSTPHVEHCNMCHCYVCDSPAPCEYWGNGTVKRNHCNSTDKDEMWISLRKFFKNLKLSPTEKHGPASSGQPISVKYYKSVQVLAPSHRLNAFQPRSAGNSLQTSPATSLSITLQPYSGTRLADPLQPCPGSSSLSTPQPALGTRLPSTLQPYSGARLADPLQPCPGSSSLSTPQTALGTKLPSTLQPYSGARLADPLQPCPGSSSLITPQPALGTRFPSTLRPYSSVDNAYLNNQRHHRQLSVHSFRSQRTGPYSATSYQLNSRAGSVQRLNSLIDAARASSISYKEPRSIYDFPIFNQNAGANSSSANRPHSSALNNNWRLNHMLQKLNSANVTSHSFQFPGVQGQISHNSHLTSTTASMDEIESARLRSYNASMTRAVDYLKSHKLASADPNIKVPSGNRQNSTVLQQANAVVSQPMPYIQEVSHRVANQGILSGQSTPTIGPINTLSYYRSLLNGGSTTSGPQQHPQGENSSRPTACLTDSIAINTSSGIIQNGGSTTTGINQNGSNHILPEENLDSQRRELNSQDD